MTEDPPDAHIQYILERIECIEREHARRIEEDPEYAAEVAEARKRNDERDRKRQEQMWHRSMDCRGANFWYKKGEKIED